MRTVAGLVAGVAVAAAALAFAAGCGQPNTLVICTNADSGEPTDPARDDTLPAFRESLKLEEGGRPVIDGIELDSFWRGSDNVCLYAHDPSDFAENTPAFAPAQELALHFAQPGPISFSDQPFLVLLELKAFVGTSTKDRRTPEQRVLHAKCAWNIYKIVSDAAAANGRDIVVEFQSFAPELLRAVIDTAPGDKPVPYTFGAVQGVPSPVDDQTRPLRDYSGLPITDVQVHPLWLQDA